MAVGGGTTFNSRRNPTKRRLKVATRGLDRVVEFAARDMTITVEAGIPIARLDEILRGEGLRLPIDIPQWDRATLGGAVAADVSGPRRFGLGTFRDYVIGLAAMKADGQVFHSGGRVVKNVAGYDLCKLLVGSRGTLAILTQITLKLKPIPEASALVCAAFANVIDREAAVAGLMLSKTRPVALDSLNRAAVQRLGSRLQLGIPTGGPALVVGYEGTQRETDWQIVTLLDELAVSRPLGLHVLRNADAVPLWNALTEFAVPTGDLPAFELQLLPSKIAAFETGCDDLTIPTAGRSRRTGRQRSCVWPTHRAADRRSRRHVSERRSASRWSGGRRSAGHRQPVGGSGRTRDGGGRRIASLRAGNPPSPRTHRTRPERGMSAS